MERTYPYAQKGRFLREKGGGQKTSGDFAPRAMLRCPQKNFLESNRLRKRRIPFQKMGEMERVQYERQVLPLLPPPPSLGVHAVRGPGVGIIGTDHWSFTTTTHNTTT